MAAVLSESLGNLASFDVGGRIVERVALESDALAKRVLRIASSRGDLGIRLDGERRLADGDVVYADDAVVIAIEVQPDDVLICRPRSIASALRLAHALGNRHVPVQVENDVLIVRYDRLYEDLARACDVPCAREQRVVREPFRHAHAPHGHGVG